jgi:hypothetical protein
MSVVAKMQCHITPSSEDITEHPQEVRFGAVWTPDEGERAKPENALFGNATPWGEIRLGIANPLAKEFFKQGKQYYVTFTEAPD